MERAASFYALPHYVGYAKELLRALDVVQRDKVSLGEASVQQLRTLIWWAQAYLEGSTRNEIPFEVEYCLRSALKAWGKPELAINTGFVDDRSFHILQVSILEKIANQVPGYAVSPEFRVELVHIALPKLYKNSPVFMLPLYHEIGHFIDNAYQVSQWAELEISLDPPAFLRSSPHFRPDPTVSLDMQSRIVGAYLREHFADLFAACYVGDAITGYLEAYGVHAPSITHPSTLDRTRVVRAFLGGTQDPVLDLLQGVLARIGKPALFVRFRLPDVTRSFNNVRTYTIADEEELHGMFKASWDYLESALNTKPRPWHDAEEGKVVEVVNNLVEKSIRNFAIRREWSDAAT